MPCRTLLVSQSTHGRRGCHIALGIAIAQRFTLAAPTVWWLGGMVQCLSNFLMCVLKGADVLYSLRCSVANIGHDGSQLVTSAGTNKLVVGLGLHVENGVVARATIKLGCR